MGSKLNGVDEVKTVTNDFALQWTPASSTPDNFVYTTSELDNFFFATSFTHFSVTAAAIPEPSTWAMMLLGFAGLGFAGEPEGPKGRLPRLTLLIRWMVCVERIAVDADRRAIALVFEARLQAVVARLAKAADRAAKEGVVIAFMRRAVIGDRRRDDEALRLA